MTWLLEHFPHVLLAVVLIGLLADMLQTIFIARHPHSRSEINPILGRHPSVRRVVLYFALCMVATVLVTQWLLFHGATAWAAWLLGGAATVEAWAVGHNWRRGIRPGALQ